MGDSDDSDDYDSFRNKVKQQTSANKFTREVKSVADLQKLKPSQIEVLEPSEKELEFELTENVPTGIEAEKHGYWFIRIRTDLPEKFHRGATVIVSINRTEYCCIWGLSCMGFKCAITNN